MSKAKTSLLLAAAMTMGSAMGAAAADLPIIEEPMPAPIVTSGWYLRGDIGVDIYKSATFSQADVTAAGGGFFQESIDTAAFAGIGVGYRVSDWIRTDVTAEFRGTEHFAAADAYNFNCAAAGLVGVGSCGGGGTIVRNNYWRGSLSSAVFMANAYFDLGKYWGVTPFVGAGIGAVRHRVHGVQEFDPGDLGGGSTATDGKNWNLAWALHAGMSYEVNDRLSMEIAYRYMDLGKAHTGALCVSPACGTTLAPLKLEDVRAHDIKLAMRWSFGGGYDYGYGY